MSEFTSSNIQTLSERILPSMLYILRTSSAFAKERDSIFRILTNMGGGFPADLSVFPLLHPDVREVDTISDFESLEPNVDVLSEYDEHTQVCNQIVFCPFSVLIVFFQLAETLEDLGYYCCSNREILTDILKNSNPALSENCVSHAVAMMARTHSGLLDRTFPFSSFGVEDASAYMISPLNAWNTDVFVHAVQGVSPNLNWAEIVKMLDNESFGVINVDGLALIISTYKCATSEAFPIEFMFGRWRNSVAQLSVLKAFIASPEEVHNLLLQSPRRVPQTDLIWGSFDFVETLLRLSDVQGMDHVAPLFAAPLSQCPDILLLAFSESRPSWGPLFRDIVSNLLDRLLRLPREDSLQVVQRVWASNKAILIQGFVEIYLQDVNPENIKRIMEIIQDLGPNALLEVLSTKQNFFFVFDLAVAAAQSYAFPLANWMTRAVAEGGDEFALNCVTFLRERFYGSNTLPHSPPLAPETAASMLQSLQSCKTGMATLEIRKLSKDAQGRLLGGAPPMQNMSMGVSAPSTVNMGAGVNGGGTQLGEGQESNTQQAVQQQQQQGQTLFPPDIEEEANSHFQRIYTSEMQIEGVIQMLKGFKLSQNQREQEVFACMIHNLFDEYRFFPRYPERELLITGKLFGSLIQHQLVSSITLGIALRYVLEALRKPLRSSMFKFGMCALEQFKSRLVEWPQYCHHILQIQHIRSSHEDLIDYIQRALSGGRAPAPDTLLSSSSVTAPTQQVLTAQSGSYMPESLIPSASQLAQSLPTSASIHSNSQAQAYGAFGMQQPGGSAAGYSGFSQGFGQDPHHQLPSNLQNFASDSSGGISGLGLGGSQDQAPQALDMRNSAVQQTLSVVTGASAFGATTNVDMLLQRAKQVIQPDTALVDKVHFIFNNLSNTNLEQKEKDLVCALNASHLPWLCQYIVIKRAAQEANYHSLYLQFCDRLDKKPTFAQLMKGVISCTIDNIKTLLADDKITSSSSVRSLLKNLGSWLGSLTLQKNKPILQKDLDFKQLIVEAYDKGRLIAVIPFIAKVIDSCANSRIFRPPNPWTMMVLGLLAELHPMSDLKLNIKFEVEVLCKSLNKELKDIKPSSVFKNRPSVKDGNSDWTSRDSNADMSLKPLPQVLDPQLVEAADRLTARSGNMGNTGMSLRNVEAASIADGQMSSSSVQSQPPIADSIQNIPNLGQYIIINPSIPIFQQFPQLRNHVMSAITVAIKEIISPVVERSVTIARITTQELILKDFAFESDESQMKTAAHMMVQNLAGSLALVTCKEPLRHSMCNQLRSMLQKMQVPTLEANALEQAAQQIAFENLDLGCNLIEKAATDKAIREIDNALDAALMLRRKPGTPLHDSFVLMQNWLRYLPEVLRPKNGGLLPHQKRVYEDFARLPRERMAAQVAAGPVAGAADLPLRSFNENVNIAGAAQGPAISQTPVQTADIRLIVEKCSACMSKAEEFILRSQIAGTSLSTLPQGHDLFQLIMQARQFVLASSQVREEVASGYAQKIFRRLYDNTKFGSCQLGIDWMLASLQTLNEVTKRVSKEITVSMAYSEAEKKLNRELTIALVQSHLLTLNAPDYVKEMVKIVEGGRNVIAVHSILSVVQHCVVDKRLISPVECSGLLELLQKVALSKGPQAKHENILKVLDDVHLISRGAIGVSEGPDKNKSADGRLSSGMVSGKVRDQPDPPHMRASVYAKMQEWADTTFMCQSTNPHSLFLNSRSFLSSLLQFGWLKGDEMTDRFFRLAVEWSIEKYQTVVGPDLSRDACASVDVFSRLVKVLFTSYESWAQSTILSKIQLLNKILAAVIKVLRSNHAERKIQFNQKPFHRLLLRMLQDDSHGSWALGISDMRLRPSEEEVQPLVIAMADTLYALQPRLVPGFSFAWLELVSHKQVMPPLLKAKGKGWASFQRLLMGLFKYLEPYLRTAELHDSTKLLYKGTLRVLLVLLHDFPEFLCEYHVTFCDAIPPSCIQLRNLILSAFPRNMQLPDPLCPGLKVDLLPEMSKAPAMVSNYSSQLVNHTSLRADLDGYLKGRVGGNSFLTELPSRLLLINAVDIANSGGRYNVPLLNAVVLHTATYAISQGHGQGGKPPVEATSSMDIFLKLSRDLDTEGRYLFLNSVANQLRWA
jgi:CCR4-NOT transcription complex subunit 1